MKAETMSRIGGYIPHYESLRHGVESPQNFEVILELIIELCFTKLNLLFVCGLQVLDLGQPIQ